MTGHVLMSRTPDSPRTPLGLLGDARREMITGVEVAALALSLLWLLATGLLFLLSPAPEGAGATGGAAGAVMTLVVTVLPVAMIWVAAITLRASRTMRAESERLQAAIDAIRQSYVAQGQGRNTASEVSLSRKLDEIAATQRKTEAALVQVIAAQEARPAPAPAASAETPPQPAPENTAADQVVLPLEATPADLQPPLGQSDFIRALNFPEHAEDRAGFAALRRAMRDRAAAQLIQAAQDILTLLSQDGIYMDDLPPEMARPEIWRRFAAGERGRAVSSLGGVRDREALERAAARMRSDTIFRDTAHHFLRLFDRMVAPFAEEATDAEIVQLADTRTARCFMLLGRVTGTFS